jgi:hypothetical protein
MQACQLQEAKAPLSKVVRLSPQEGPQGISSRGEEVVHCWGHLTGNSSEKLGAVGGLIAAKCLAFSLRLITRSTKDFKISHLEIINPWI